MARKTTIRLPGVRTHINNIKNVLSEEAAAAIVYDLKLRGPYWTGEFEENWVVRLGDVKIAGTKEHTIQPGPQPRPFLELTPVEIPKAVGRKSITYSIGNRMKYRNIAMDLEPGRIKVGPGTAEQDWYLDYMQGDGLRKSIKIATGRTVNKPIIRGYGGKA